MRDEPFIETSKKRLRKTGMVFCNINSDCSEGEVCFKLSHTVSFCLDEEFSQRF